MFLESHKGNTSVCNTCVIQGCNTYLRCVIIKLCTIGQGTIDLFCLYCNLQTLKKIHNVKSKYCTIRKINTFQIIESIHLGPGCHLFLFKQIFVVSTRTKTYDYNCYRPFVVIDEARKNRHFEELNNIAFLIPAGNEVRAWCCDDVEK